MLVATKHINQSKSTHLNSINVKPRPSPEIPTLVLTLYPRSARTRVWIEDCDAQLTCCALEEAFFGSIVRRACQT